MRVALATAVLGVCLVVATVSCGPTPSAGVSATPTSDPFAVVRATSEAAYEKGQAELQNGQLQQALVDLDTAKTNDPDNRQDIQQALDQTVHALQSQTPTAAPTSPPRTIVVATLPVPSPAAQSIPSPAAQPALSPVAGASPSPVALVGWADPQGRFSIGAPQSWSTVPQPQSFVGAAAVEFQDPTGRAELDVAVDSGARAVSPELYAATLELSMQQQVPGYASEQIQPVTVGGTAAIRRVFTFTQRDATGTEHQARALQIVLLKGSTPYIISGVAPAEVFNSSYGPLFQQMVDSFQFS